MNLPKLSKPRSFHQPSPTLAHAGSRWLTLAVKCPRRSKAVGEREHDVQHAGVVRKPLRLQVFDRRGTVRN